MTPEEINARIAAEFMHNEAGEYVSDILSASRVLTVLHKRGWFWRLDSVHDGVICTIQNELRKTYSVRAPTISGAICEVAMRTLQYQDKI